MEQMSTINQMQLKNALKGALSEFFDEKRNLLYDIISEVLEDMAMMKAIQHGEQSDSVSRATIFEILEAPSES